MEDQFSKYLRLFGNILFSFIGFILLSALLLLGLRFLMGALDYMSWFSYIYMCCMLLLPAGLFISVYMIFYKRTKNHPVKIVRLLSNLLFAVGILIWIVLLVIDFVNFFKNGYQDIGKYFSYQLLPLTSNVAVVFLTGVMQALTTAKEKDWMEKHADNK
jgi:hypothetical protein